MIRFLFKRRFTTKLIKRLYSVPQPSESSFMSLFPRTLTRQNRVEKHLENSAKALKTIPGVERLLSEADFQEKISAIYLNLRAASLLKAEVLFLHLYRSNGMDLVRFVDAGLFNAFITAYLDRDGYIEGIDRAEEWYRRIASMGYEPNLRTFVLLGSVYCGSRDALEEMIKNMSAFGLDPPDLLRDSRFRGNHENVAYFKTILGNLGLGTGDLLNNETLLVEALRESSTEYVANSPMLESMSTATSDVDLFSQWILDETSKNYLINVPYSHESEIKAETPKLLLQPNFLDEIYRKTARELESMGTSQSKGVTLLAETLKKLVTSSSADPIVKYKQQEWLEEECVRLAFESASEIESSKPESIRGVQSLRQGLANKWMHSLAESIETALQDNVAFAKAERKKASLDAICDEVVLGDDFDFRENESTDIKFNPPIEYFRPLDAKKLALITISEFMKFCTRREMKEGKFTGDMIATQLLLSIGRQVKSELTAQEFKLGLTADDRLLDYHLHSLFRQGKLFNKKIRQVAAKITRDNQKKVDQRLLVQDWPDDMNAKIGAILAKFLIKVAKVPVLSEMLQPDGSVQIVSNEEPAFYHVIERMPGKSYKTQGKIKHHQMLAELLKPGDPGTSLIPKLLPMIVPPKPWMSYNRGGYLTQTGAQPLIRLNGNKDMHNLLKTADVNGKLGTIFHALDVLGATPWRINRLVLDIVMKCWTDGREWPSIASSKPIPQPSYPANPAQLRSYYMEKSKAKNAEMSRYSQRCDANYKILISKAFENEQLYFPHYIDFRGRAYPLSVHLNHIGNDLCRSLMLFDEAKPLGVVGLRWLKIQTANLYGIDKLSYEGRLEFVEKNLLKIFDCADNPLTGTKYWLKAEEPWQFLASCIELTTALRAPDPTAYESRMPIHQDGTCNGLQHYAALGRDLDGAKQVNLYPGNKPGDVYSGIASKVNDFVNSDAKKGVPEALIMQGKISRKLVKQTVMTNTYGVTLIGARAQVRARMKESREENSYSDSDIAVCAPYITGKIFQSYGNLFSSAQRIQNWLVTSAKMISRSIPEDTLESELIAFSNAVLGIGGENLRLSINKKLFGEFYDDLSSINLPSPPPPPPPPPPTLTSDDIEAEKSSESDFSVSSALSVSNILLFKNSRAHKDQYDFLMARAAKREERSVVKVTKPPRDIPVIWTTPVGLPVVQPYKNYQMKTVKTCVQSLTLRDTMAPVQINAIKQGAAFPPNFVHSLDAAHMMMTAISCKDDNVTFAAVHDSFWCHASDVDTMSSHLRENFINLHKDDIMIKLKREFEVWNDHHYFPISVELDEGQLDLLKKHLIDSGRMKVTSKRKLRSVFLIYIKLELPPLPGKGDFDIGMVRDSKYFFH